MIRRAFGSEELVCKLCGEAWVAGTHEETIGAGWRTRTFMAIDEDDAECPLCGGHDTDCECGDCPTASEVRPEARAVLHSIGLDLAATAALTGAAASILTWLLT